MAALCGVDRDPFIEEEYGEYENAECVSFSSSLLHPRQLSAYPILTTSSIIGMCFDEGVVLAGNMGCFYGKMMRFDNCPRIKVVNSCTILGASGDFADFQYLESVIDSKLIDEERLNDNFQLKPRSLHSWLTRVLHNRRNKFDPLWTSILVGGLQDGKPFLGFVDKLGMPVETPAYATGFGTYLALPMLMEAYEKRQGKPTREEAIETVKDAARVLFYRDCYAHNKIQIGVCTKDGCSVEGPIVLTSSWEVAKCVNDF